MKARFPRLTGQLLIVFGLIAALVGVSPAGAAEAPVLLGTAGSFAVLAGSTVTNTGPSLIRGDLGVSPGTAVTGFPPGEVVSGTIHAANGVADQAQLDLVTAYNDAAGRSATATVTADLGGQTLVSGVYSGPTLGLTGTLTLDAQGVPGAVFIFQAGSTLITETTSRVSLVNGAQACNVYWQVGSSATLGTGSVFAGTILALTAITATTSASVSGRLLAREAAVTLDSNNVTRPTCAQTTTTTGAQTTTTSSASGSTTVPPGTTAGTGGSTTGGATASGGGGGTTGGNATGESTTGGGTTGRTTSGGGGGSTPGGQVPQLPATGQGISAMTVAGLLAIGLGSAALHASASPGSTHWPRVGSSPARRSRRAR